MGHTRPRYWDPVMSCVVYKRPKKDEISDWIMHVSNSSKRSFFVNRDTGVKTWTLVGNYTAPTENYKQWFLTIHPDDMKKKHRPLSWYNQAMRKYESTCYTPREPERARTTYTYIHQVQNGWNVSIPNTNVLTISTNEQRNHNGRHLNHQCLKIQQSSRFRHRNRPLRFHRHHHPRRKEHQNPILRISCLFLYVNNLSLTHEIHDISKNI